MGWYLPQNDPYSGEHCYDDEFGDGYRHDRCIRVTLMAVRKTKFKTIYSRKFMLNIPVQQPLRHLDVVPGWNAYIAQVNAA